MAYVIWTQTPDGPRFARNVGKKGVKWTDNRDEARRYVHWDTASRAADRIRDLGALGAIAAPLPSNDGG